MKSSHPPALLRSVERTLRRSIRLPRGAGVVLAVSGGPDSMALLHALCCLRERLELRLSVASVDHGLRPEAAEEVELVARFAAEQGVPFEAVSLRMQAGGNVQARAREARYAALWRIVERTWGEEGFLATAHHEQDRAETVLLRLLRGTSLAGLGVLAPREGRLLRPLIEVSRAAILAHVARHELPCVQDPSNRDPRFLRVRVRHELLPLLQELSPGIVRHLVHLAEEAGEQEPAWGLNYEQRKQLRAALLGEQQAIDLQLPGGLRVRREKSTKKSPVRPPREETH